MKHHIQIPMPLLGVTFSVVLALFAMACGKKEPVNEPASEPSVEAVKPGVVPVKPVQSAPKTPDGGPQTHEEYVTELGKVAQERQSFGRRIAMATEAVRARERVLKEENEALRAAEADVKKCEAMLAAAEKTLLEARKALTDAYAADADWKAADEKLQALTKEAESAQLRTTLMIQDARKKGIHLQPKDLTREASSASESPKP